MARKWIYWVSTVLVAAPSLLAAVAYLTASPEVVAGFARVGYPQQLRVLLGIAKPLGALVLIVPGFPILKEWAYAGFTFAWIAATLAHYLAGEGSAALMPVGYLIVLAVSYLTRPPSRRCPAGTAVATP